MSSPKANGVEKSNKIKRLAQRNRIGEMGFGLFRRWELIALILLKKRVSHICAYILKGLVKLQLRLFVIVNKVQFDPVYETQRTYTYQILGHYRYLIWNLVEGDHFVTLVIKGFKNLHEI